MLPPGVHGPIVHGCVNKIIALGVHGCSNPEYINDIAPWCVLTYNHGHFNISPGYIIW